MTVTEKVCTKCGPPAQPIENLGWKSKLHGVRHAVCKTRTAKRPFNWYYENKDAHIQNVMVHKEEARIEARQFVWDYLSTHPRVGCGETDPVVLEFDHVSGKDANVSRLVADGVSIARIRQEINLCGQMFELSPEKDS